MGGMHVETVVKQGIREKVEYQNPSLRMQIQEVSNSLREYTWYGPWHYHPQIELIVLISGEMKIETRDQIFPLQTGDVLFLGSSSLHRSVKEAKIVTNKYYVLKFDPLLLMESPAGNCLRTDHGENFNEVNSIIQGNPLVRQSIHRLAGNIYEEMHNRERGYEIAAFALLNQIVSLLIRHDRQGILHSRKSSEMTRLLPVLKYIDAHIEEKITVEDVCSLLHLNYHYFIRLFKSIMGISFTEYVHVKRIKKAEALLLTENLSITEIGARSGFPNTAQFNKIFRRYNSCSPTEFKIKCAGM